MTNLDSTLRKGMTNLSSIFKSRDITLPTKVCLVKATVFLQVMYGCDGWLIKKACCRRGSPSRAQKIILV